MIYFEQIQSRLVEAIKQSGMSKSEIALKLGISKQQISRYMQGQKMPALDTLANLLKILDEDANYILCLD